MSAEVLNSVVGIYILAGCDAFMNYQSGIMSDTSCGDISTNGTDHAISVVGYQYNAVTHTGLSRTSE